MRDKTLALKFGTTIRRLRVQAKMSQEDFANYCHLHRTYVSLIERGERIVSIETADKLAKALNIPLSQLFAHMETEEGIPDNHLSQLFAHMETEEGIPDNHEEKE